MKKRVALFMTMVLTIAIVAVPMVTNAYEVKDGDLLWKIAEDLGVSTEELAEANNLENPNMIYPGQTLTMDTITASEEAKYIFMFIGDGLGASQRQISEYYKQVETGNNDAKLLMNTFPVAGINTTYSNNSLITDSAAAGTALASGVKTNNGVIGKDADLNDVKTLIDGAEAAGMATGLASTTRLTHATPAAFASHNESRNNENEIAVDFLDSGVDYFAGGGIRYFIPQDMTGTDATGGSFTSKREDDRNLIAEFEDQGYTTFLGLDGAKAFETSDLTNEDQVFAVFTSSHLPYELDRETYYPECPTLAELTAGGIDVLSQDEDGFFFMIEGGRIDHAAHANDAPGTIHDTLAFDEAIAEAYDFYLRHPNETLILVVGDHETGGMGLGMDAQGYFIDMAPLMGVDTSTADVVLYGDGAYTGDREAFIAYAKKHFDLEDITDAEMAALTAGMDASDAEETYGYYNYDSAGMALAQIISSRANINWTTTIHTATAIPMSAIGTGADKFGGYKDNTEIAHTMANYLGFTLSK